MWKVNYIQFLTLLLAFFSMPFHAQNVAIKHYGVSNGLPSSESYWVMQDSKGYIWIATDAGVVKYDGYSFKTYNSNKGLPDNTVFKIHEDRHGRIWFSTYSGKLAYYLHKSDSIVEINANAKLSTIIKTLPVDFSFDSKDTLYLSLDRKGYLKVLPPEYDKVIPVNYPMDCAFLKQLDNGNIVYGVNYKNISTTQTYVSVILDHHGKIDSIGSLVAQGSSNIGFSKNGATAVLTTSIRGFIYENKRLVPFVDCSKKQESSRYGIITPYVDSKGRCWINTTRHGTLCHVLKNKNEQYDSFLGNFSVSSAFEDKSGGMWFTTLEDGVFYVPSLNFKFYTSIEGKDINNTLGITYDSTDLVALTSDFDLNFFESGNDSIADKIHLIDPAWGLKKCGDQIIVLGSPSYIFTKDKKTRVSIYSQENGKRIILRLKCIADYDADFVLGAEFGNLYLINKSTGEAIALTKDLPKIFSILRVGDVIYIGTKSGLYCYIHGKTSYLGENSVLLKSRIDDILPYNNKLILATRGSGVYVFESASDIKQYTEKDGLASNIVKSLALGKDGIIWAGTNRGISRIILKDYGESVINSINASQGLISAEINQLLVKDSIVFFATNKGVGRFNSKEIFNGQDVYPTYIEGLNVKGEKCNLDSFMSLSYDQNIIQIFYRAINVKSEGDILYKYRLEGLDTNWVYSKNTFVQYTTLPSGKYKFVVYALSSEGLALSNPAEIQFEIKPPFWFTWWFILVFLILSLGILYLIYSSRIRVIRQNEEEKTQFNKQLAESELRALRSQMNPHFMFNAINSIQSFVLKNDSKSAQKYLTKFARLIRSVLENSKHEFVLLSREIDSLELYIELEALRASFSFDYEIVIDDSVNTDYSFIPPMLIQPYVENAILHGLAPLTERRGKLQLIFTKVGEGKLSCVIDDNGVGRKRAMELKVKKDLSKTSIGMQVTKDRIAILNSQSNLFAKVDVIDKMDDDIPMGTRIEIVIEILKNKD